ncbi:MAG: pirin family protein [Treponema sp.]|nr:pirin family protein [Treponema sp.]
MAVRELDRILNARTTRDGAGVTVHRVFGVGTENLTDPFLLLDEVNSCIPEEYSAGFPLHPHRGIDIVTYMLSGFLRQVDSLGKACMIGPGCLQWLTAGSGVIHEEMPLESAVLRGFQIWINLPRAGKMVDPLCREAAPEEIPVVPILGGKVRVLAGRFGGASGPVIGVQGKPGLLDVELDPGAVFLTDLPPERTGIVHIFEGGPAEIGSVRTEELPESSAFLLGTGDSARLRAGPRGARFLLLSGTPLREPIAWKGPVVMNEMSEVDLAYKEYGTGTFVKAL